MNGPAARRAARGFGLIEVVVSGTLLIIGVTAMVQSFALAERQQKHQRIVNQALIIAEATTERLIALYADNAQLSDGAHSGVGYDVLGARTSGSAFFQSSWDVDVGTPFSGARVVVVTVSWQEDGTTRQIQLRTLRT